MGDNATSQVMVTGCRKSEKTKRDMKIIFNLHAKGRNMLRKEIFFRPFGYELFVSIKFLCLEEKLAISSA